MIPEIGAVIGRLTVLSLADIPRSKSQYICRCSCGKEVTIPASYLGPNRKKSCGCLYVELKKNPSPKTHSFSYNPLLHATYKSITRAWGRCYSSKNPSFAGYGARGIRFCEEWLLPSGKPNVELVVALLGERPHGMSLDRIDNDKNYEPGNVRWATASMQQRNKRNTVRIEGVSLSDLAEARGLNPNTVHGRYRKGDRGERLFRTPRRGC